MVQIGLKPQPCAKRFRTEQRRTTATFQVRAAAREAQSETTAMQSRPEGGLLLESHGYSLRTRVYQASFSYHSSRYIGQTGNALHHRNKAHERATRKGEAASPFVEHYDKYHTVEGVRKPLRIKMRVLGSGKKHAKRTISEALRILERKPELNRKDECVASTVLYIDLNEEQRKQHRKRVYE